MKKKMTKGLGEKNKTKLKRFITKLKMITLAMMIFVIAYFIIMVIVEFIKSKF